MPVCALQNIVDCRRQGALALVNVLRASNRRARRPAVTAGCLACGHYSFFLRSADTWCNPSCIAVHALSMRSSMLVPAASVATQIC